MAFTERELPASPDRGHNTSVCFVVGKRFVCAFHPHGDFKKYKPTLENWEISCKNPDCPGYIGKLGSGTSEQYSSMATIPLPESPSLSDSICLLCVMGEGLKSLEESFPISVLEITLVAVWKKEWMEYQLRWEAD